LIFAGTASFSPVSLVRPIVQEETMKQLLAVIIAFVGLTLVAVDADARRFGGGRNLGMQRSAPAAPQKAAPAQQQQPQQQAAQGTPAQQPSGASKWLGPLAGLALGAGLAALFLNNGIAGLLAGLLVLGLIAAAMVFLARAVRGRLAQQPMQYAGFPGTGQPPSALPGGAGAHSVAATTGSRPAGFDEAEFVRHAKLNFVRLQEAHDKKDLTTMRDFLAPEVYREIEGDIRSAWGSEQKTEVVTLNAEVVEVAEEAGSYIVSVRFTGMVREAADRQPEAISEIWHLEKPVSGRGGWVVAGIQQA
jgi:predicted lipid-binding transport protein (Tim44 family)